MHLGSNTTATYFCIYLHYLRNITVTVAISASFAQFNGALVTLGRSRQAYRRTFYVDVEFSSLMSVSPMKEKAPDFPGCGPSGKRIFSEPAVSQVAVFRTTTWVLHVCSRLIGFRKASPKATAGTKVKGHLDIAAYAISGPGSEMCLSSRHIVVTDKRACLIREYDRLVYCRYRDSLRVPIQGCLLRALREQFAEQRGSGARDCPSACGGDSKSSRSTCKDRQRRISTVQYFLRAL